MANHGGDTAALELGSDYMHILITRDGHTEEEAAEAAAQYYDATKEELFDFWMNG
jgi:hypothetical protein